MNSGKKAPRHSPAMITECAGNAKGVRFSLKLA
jgi:hypothetical protein